MHQFCLPIFHFNTSFFFHLHCVWRATRFEKLNPSNWLIWRIPSSSACLSASGRARTSTTVSLTRETDWSSSRNRHQRRCVLHFTFVDGAFIVCQCNPMQRDFLSRPNAQLSRIMYSHTLVMRVCSLINALLCYEAAAQCRMHLSITRKKYDTNTPIQIVLRHNGSKLPRAFHFEWSIEALAFAPMRARARAHTHHITHRKLERREEKKREKQTHIKWTGGRYFISQIEIGCACESQWCGNGHLNCGLSAFYVSIATRSRMHTSFICPSFDSRVCCLSCLSWAEDMWISNQHDQFQMT